jgi:hypothetical protein
VPSIKNRVCARISKEPGGKSKCATKELLISNSIAGHPINGAIDMAAFPMRGIFGGVYSTCPNVSPDGITLNFVMREPMSKATTA